MNIKAAEFSDQYARDKIGFRSSTHAGEKVFPTSSRLGGDGFHSGFHQKAGFHRLVSTLVSTKTQRQGQQNATSVEQCNGWPTTKLS